jgi:hypothetical protein
MSAGLVGVRLVVGVHDQQVDASACRRGTSPVRRKVPAQLAPPVAVDTSYESPTCGWHGGGVELFYELSNDQPRSLSRSASIVSRSDRGPIDVVSVRDNSVRSAELRSYPTGGVHQ